MTGSAAHIPFSRFHAALSAGDLTFVRAHRTSFTLGLVDEIRIAALTAVKDPAGLQDEAARCRRRFAAETAGRRPEDDTRLASAFREMADDPESGTRELLALCAEWGIE